MQVTVYDKVPAAAEISVEQVVAYARRRGQLDGFDERTIRDWKRWALGHNIGDAIEQMAAQEGRQPSTVLADIAKEPT